MIPLSLVFSVFSICGVLLVAFANDESYKKLGLYIFLVFFLLMALQMLVDYPAEQNITAVVIMFASALLIIVFMLDLLKIMKTAVELVRKRR
jgi:sugar phosphate permease